MKNNQRRIPAICQISSLSYKGRKWKSFSTDHFKNVFEYEEKNIVSLVSFL